MLTHQPPIEFHDAVFELTPSEFDRAFRQYGCER